MTCPLIEMLMEDVKEKGVTEISLDATEEGRTLYEKAGFDGMQPWEKMSVGTSVECLRKELLFGE